MTINIAVAGITGRLGALCAAAVEAAGATIVGGWGRDRAAAADVLRRADVLIDVSAAEAVPRHAALARASGVAWVLGTTGLDEAAMAEVEAAARVVPVVRAANFAPGLTVLLTLVERLAKALDGGAYDAEIFEMHHRGKRDAPSGTALALGEAIARGRGVALADVAAMDRSGVRQANAIGFAMQRGGATVGEHRVTFAGLAETISVEHRATDRRVFAKGAVRAALWAVGQAPGIYGMADVLGL